MQTSIKKDEVKNFSEVLHAKMNSRSQELYLFELIVQQIYAKDMANINPETTLILTQIMEHGIANQKEEKLKDTEKAAMNYEEGSDKELESEMTKFKDD